MMEEAPRRSSSIFEGKHLPIPPRGTNAHLGSDFTVSINVTIWTYLLKLPLV
jgi:hypothetical protein